MPQRGRGMQKGCGNALAVVKAPTGGTEGSSSAAPQPAPGHPLLPELSPAVEAEPSSPAARCPRHVTGSARSPASLSGSVTAILSAAAPPAPRLPHGAQRARLNPPKTPRNQQQTSSHPAPTAPVSIPGYNTSPRVHGRQGKRQKVVSPRHQGRTPALMSPVAAQGFVRCPLSRLN